MAGSRSFFKQSLGVTQMFASDAHVVLVAVVVAASYTGTLG